MENSTTKTVTYRIWVEWMGWICTVWTTETEEEFEIWAAKEGFIKEEDGIYRGKPNNKGIKPYLQFQ